MARKILLADDSVTAQNMGRKILADAGYEVITVNNGSAALKKIAEQRPDLIVLDVYMPGYSGLEVCQRLKEAHETASIPVLLTVGKLEPFKPEEAKRVRAESFIVKPFEASALLSVLSKLEDKIVPRSAPSKSGRFARAIAEVEESSRSQRDQTGDERSGWKKRISFPSKKQAASDEDDSPIYNAMNRDLRTVVNHEKARQEPITKPEAAAPEESRVDMTAIAAPGAPSDVSPEEIAAIAAAAAQVQAAVSAAKDSSTDSSEEKRLTTTEEIPKLEHKLQSKEEANPPEAHPGVEHADKARLQAASRTNAELIAAIAALEPANGGTWAGSGNGAGPSSKEQADAPATMASAGDGSADSRWVAIPVAMAAAEAAISLELEMQKAYAAFAAAEANHPGFVTPASAVEASSPETSAPIPDSTAEVDAPPALSQEPELTNTVNAVASASAEAVSAAAEKLAAVAGSYVEAESAPVQAPAAPVQAEAQSVAETAPTYEEVAPPQEPPLAPPVQNVEEAVAAEPAPASAGSMNQDEPQSVAQPASLVSEATAVPSESPAGGTGIMAENKESHMTANTAAAWASWRQIRDSAEPGSVELSKAHKQEDDDDQPAPSSELAAMAVAAGAEKSPVDAEASDADPAAIASIVDSVLADLRPKIVEEISKKLGKKK